MMYYYSFSDFGNLADFFVKESSNCFQSVFSQDFKQTYPYDIYKEEDGYVIEIAAIGLDKSDLKIEVEKDILKVLSTKEANEKKFLKHKISKKPIDLSFKISEEFNISGITSKLEKGALIINVPFSKETKDKKFSVNIE